MTTSTKARGRIAKTKGVSMLPEELEDVRVLEALTGIGFSELYHQRFAPQVQAAVRILTELVDSGMEVDRSTFRDQWNLSWSPDARHDLYTSESELTVGE